MPMFITNTKLQYKPKSFFHCTLPLRNFMIDSPSNIIVPRIMVLMIDDNITQNGHKRMSKDFRRYSKNH